MRSPGAKPPPEPYQPSNERGVSVWDADYTDELSTRIRRAARVNTAPDVLEQAAADPDPRLRWTVALNPNTPTAVLAQLADDPEPAVRSALCSGQLPWRLVVQLTEDPDGRVRHAARNRVELASKVPHTQTSW